MDSFGDVLKTYKVPPGKCQFEAVSWEGIYLGDALLSGANFANAKLYWANFTEANLDGANFERANLQGAILTNASCVGANFRYANLGRDNLGGTSWLFGANFTNAILNRAILEGAEYNDQTIFPKGFHPKSHGMIETNS